MMIFNHYTNGQAEEDPGRQMETAGSGHALPGILR